MKKIFIEDITMSNFGAIELGQMELSPATNKIVAKSGSGKTTIIDSIKFVLGFDTLMLNSFVPTMQKDGELSTMPIPNKDTKVSVNFNIDGVTVPIERISKQKYSTSIGEDGTPIKKYMGNDSANYFINGLAFNFKNFTKEIENLFGFEFEKLPLFLELNYFTSAKMGNTAKKTNADTERRKLLLNSCEELVSELENKLLDKKEYANIKSYFAKGYSIEDTIAMLKKTINGISSEIDTNNTIYENNTNQIVLLKQKDYETFKEQKKLLEQELELLNNRNLNTEDFEKQKIQEELLNKKRTLRIKKAENQEVIENVKSNLILKSQKIKTQESNLDNAKRDLSYNEKKLSNLVAEKEDEKKYVNSAILRITNSISDLENELISLKNQTYDGDDKCDKCGQTLPDEMLFEYITTWDTKQKIKIKEASEKIEYENEKLDDARKQFKFIDEEYLQKEEVLQKAIAKNKTQISTYINEVAKAKEQYEKTPKSVGVESLDRLEQEIESLELKLSELENETPVTNVEQQKSQLKQQIEEVSKELNGLQMITYYDDHNEKLKEELIELQNKDLIAKQEMSDIKRFNKEKCELLNDTINAFFPEEITVILYKYQPSSKDEFNIFSEMCQIAYNSKQYSELSNGEKIQANYLTQIGLQKIQNVHFPIFIDDYALNNRPIQKIEQQQVVIDNDKDNIKTLPFAFLKELEK